MKNKIKHILPAFEKYAIDYRSLKVGDKCFSFIHGIITLDETHHSGIYVLKSGKETFTVDGRFHESDKYPVLYHPSILELFEKLEYPKMMEVSDTSDYSISAERLVIGKTIKGQFIAMVTEQDSVAYLYAREIQPREAERVSTEAVIKFLKRASSSELQSIIKNILE